MKKQISHEAFEEALRGHFAADVPEPATLADVLSKLDQAPVRTRRFGFGRPAFAAVALAAVLVAAVALVAIPLSRHTEGMVEPDQSPYVTPVPTPTVPPTPRPTDPLSMRFVATGDMTVGRSFGHSATLLKDGRVLVAGGCAGSSNAEGCVHTATAELYDPRTGKFEATGSMHEKRAEHTATLLPDGKVLIAGGHYTGEAPLASAELYDPATGKFTITGSMAKARWGATAALLENGRVFIYGGRTDDPYQPKFGELYDPATGRFTQSASSTVEHDDCTVTLLADGRVLIAGGTSPGRDRGVMIDVPDIGATSAELYDPETNAFSPAGAMAEPRRMAKAILLPDGRVLIMGGTDAKTPPPVRVLPRSRPMRYTIRRRVVSKPPARCPTSGRTTRSRRSPAARC